MLTFFQKTFPHSRKPSPIRVREIPCLLYSTRVSNNEKSFPPNGAKQFEFPRHENTDKCTNSSEGALPMTPELLPKLQSSVSAQN